MSGYDYPAFFKRKMTAEQALRYVAYQAERCSVRDLETHRALDMGQALRLLPPALLKALDLAPMTDYEVREFNAELRAALHHVQLH